MWFGTRSGLNRFNGYEFEVFFNDPGNSSSISDNNILSMMEDANKNLWIGTNNGLNRFDASTNTFKRFLPDPDNTASISNKTISTLCLDSKRRLWIGTSNGLNMYNEATDSFERITHEMLRTNSINTIVSHGNKLYIGTRIHGILVFDTESRTFDSEKNYTYNLESISTDDVRTIYVDNKENLWAGTYHNGAICLKKNDRQVIRYNRSSGMTNNFVRSITQSPEGDILAATFNGLNVIDPVSGKITQYNSYETNRGNLSHYSINTVFFDNSQTLWVGTYGEGVDYYSPYEQKFKYYDPRIDLKTIIGIIGPVVEIENYLYIATEGGGILEFNKSDETFKHYLLDNNSQESYNSNILKTLYADGDRILCGTYLGTVHSFDLKTKKFTLVHDLKEEKPIYHISRLRNGNLVISSVSNRQGLVIIDKSGKVNTQFKILGTNENISFPNVRCFLEINPDIYLIGTKNEGLFYYNANDNRLIQHKTDGSVDKKNNIPENYVSSIFKDRSNNIWVGTFGGGVSLFDPSNNKFTTYNTSDNLLNNNVCSIVEDEDQHLWISTTKGISDFDINTKSFKNYTNTDGLKVDEFTPHAGLRMKNGNIVFSGNNGFILFNPVKMTFNPNIPSVMLGNLFVNNVMIQPGGEDGILSKQLSMQKELTLRYNQSNIAIDYNALNYVFANRNQYAYILEGFDQEWNEVGTRRIAYYTNIPPGTYVFKVRGSNNDGIWNNQGTSIVIKVLPPYWKTWWAYCIYIVALAGILILIFRYFSEKKRLENDIKIKQAEANAQEEFHQARSSLFTNFSHELRTPLTLIISPLEDIIDKYNDLNPKIKSNLMLMRNNARRLLRQVNNLMDFQKKESGTLKLKVSESDFIEFSSEMIFCFNDLAETRNIGLTFDHNADSLKFWYDKAMMEKVYFNFLSNAFKNTPDGGEVDVKLNIESFSELKDKLPQQMSKFENKDIPYLFLEIKDTGVGIEQSELTKIFVPFYQVAQNEHSASGTGLGLSLSKSIIELHGGTIWAESPEGNGAIFRCILPVTKEHFKDSEIMTDFEEDDSTIYEIESITKETVESYDNRKKHSILVVEDNASVRQYIVSQLSGDYNVMEASNGDEAVEKAILHLPDLIVSDLMMPKMNGLEMCRIVKTDIRTSHIPIIMITACATSANIKEGYETGADDYITKPFNSSVLVTRIENIIRSREKLKDIYGKRFSLESLGVEAVSVDERFMQKLYDVLEKNISNPNLNLEVFCQTIGISRANLYRKIKSITNLGANEFIRNFRLEMAAKLMKEAKLSVSDVYVEVGFNSVAYFSNCFKALYGISPSEYIKSLSDNE